MAVSQNGWPVYVSSGGLVPMGYITGRVAPGSAAKVLGYVAEQFNKRVEKVDVSDSWGWANRPIRGSKTISNHASGTAIDLNSSKHPLGAKGTFTPNQRSVIHAILRECGGVVRWGGDYAGRKDEMHFEINASRQAVDRVAARLGAGSGPGGKRVAEDCVFGRASTSALQKIAGTPVDGLITGQSRVNAKYYKAVTTVRYGSGGSSLARWLQRWAGAGVDGLLGPGTIRAVQRKLGISADGYWGRDTSLALQRWINAH